MDYCCRRLELIAIGDRSMRRVCPRPIPRQSANGFGPRGFTFHPGRSLLATSDSKAHRRAVLSAQAWRRYLSDAPNEPGDEILGQWTRAQLEQMDARFCLALKRPSASGQEQPPSS